MKKYIPLIGGMVGCLLVAAVGYFWATGLIGSVFSFRSPLKDNPPTPGASLGTRLTRRVVIVLIDALRVDTAADATTMPFLDSLRARSASATMHSHPPSFSEPGYTTILTGAWPDINDGPPVNLDYADIPTFTQDDLFSAAHRAGLSTAISGYYWFEKLVPQTSVDASFYTPGEDTAADKDVMKAAIPMLTGDYQLVLIHIDQVDYAGHHLGGPGYPAWKTAATQADDYLQQIVSYLDLNQDTVIVLSDHGQINRGGHGGPEAINLQEPFVMAGPAVQPSTYPDIEMVDVAPTIATLLGTNIPASSEGFVLTKMLSLPAGFETKIQAGEIAQKSQLLKAYEKAIHSPAGQPSDPSNSLAYMVLLNKTRSDRLSQERSWRTIAALFVLILPAFFLVINWSKKVTWLAVGAALYALLFNFRYAILDSKSYSLSSVDSEMGLITYTAITAAVCMIIAWLIVMLRLNAFRSGSRKAADTSLEMVLMTIYLLGIPIVISFAVNGLTNTWTMPEFYTLFIAVQSLIEWIFVALTGLLLIGAGALVARFIPKPVEKYKHVRR